MPGFFDLDHTRGLYKKYNVERVDDPDGKHDECSYFVLDLKHDPHARRALEMYIVSCKGQYPELSYDLSQLLEEVVENDTD